MINIGFIKNKKSRQTRDAPGVAVTTLRPEDLIEIGYTPLSNNEEVLKCVHVIADLVSDMTIKLMENGEDGDYRIRNELSKKIDIAPNALTTRKTFIYGIVKDLCLSGNKIVLPEIESRTYNDADHSYVKNLTPIPVSRVSFVDKTLSGYRVRIGTHTYNPDELLHFVLMPNRESFYIGEGFGPLVAKTVKDLSQAQTTKSSFLRSKWKPSLIISTQSDAEELADKEKRKKLLDSYTETTEAAEPWVIPAGEIDIKTVSPLTLNDLAIIDSMKLDKQSIASAFGVPAFLIGVGTYNKDEYNNFVSTVIMSIAKVIQQELTKKLLLSSRMYFEFNVETLMQYQLTEKIQYVKEMVGGGIINRNEGRDRLGISPVDNEGMNDFVVLENYIPVAKIGEQKKLSGGEQ